MRITESKLRSIIRSVIRENDSNEDIFRPFDEDDMDIMDDSDEMKIIDADEIPQLDQPAPQRGYRRDGSPREREMRDFMSRNRKAGAARDRGDRYVPRGVAHRSQVDMLDDDYDI